MAGIRVFATGGIGGVHRGAETSFDISADLEELGRTPVAVVCAGAKSILDIPKTLEVLETKGVPVLGYRTDDFPAFWARTSGHQVDRRYDDAADDRRGDRDAVRPRAWAACWSPTRSPRADALDAAEMRGAGSTAAIADAEQRGRRSARS